MGRLYKTIDRGWRFHRGDCPEAWFRGYDESTASGAWVEVTLPHDWAVREPFSPEHSSGGGYLAGGVGWYRGTFSLPEACRGKKVWIVFDGVYNNAQVWANSYYLGKWPYGYSTFTYDISHAARFGEDHNQVSVRVDHAHTADSRWFTGSGIYRKVSVLVKEPVYLEQYGVFFSTPEVNADAARLYLSIALANDTGEATCGLVRNTLQDPSGTAVAQIETPWELPAGGRGCVEQEGTLEAPLLWSPAHPHLYTLVTELLIDGTVIDSECNRVGVRSARFDPDEGFFLNGVNTKLKGVCVHHDAGCLGAAVPPKVWQRRLEKLQAAGCNAIRMSHNPHMPELYDLCDELGLLVIDESFDEWEGPKNKWWQGHNVYPPKHYGYFEDFPIWHERDQSLLVQRDRNHPCVILWSIGNEIDYPNDPYGHPSFESMTGNNDANKPAAERRYSPDRPNAERLVPLAQRLKAIVKQWDRTRPVTAAVAFPELSNITGFCDVLDVCGYNYKEQWYAEDHKKYPHRPLLGSENGHHYGAWLAVRDQPFIAGQFLWTGIDYLGEAPGWPVHGSSAGLLTTAGFPKAQYWFRQSLWTDEPMAHLATARHEQEDSPLMQELPAAWRRYARRMRESCSWNYALGDCVDVTCYTNCPEAELFLNGVSQGISHLADFPEEGCLSWQVPFAAGTLEVVATAADGRKITHRLVTTGAAAALQAHVYGEPTIRADGEDIAQIEIAVVDGAGNLVPNAADMVGVVVKGAATLLGIDSGDLADNTILSASERRAYRGHLIVYVRSNGETGPLTIYCHGQGLLQPALVQLTAV